VSPCPQLLHTRGRSISIVIVLATTGGHSAPADSLICAGMEEIGGRLCRRLGLEVWHRFDASPPDASPPDLHPRLMKGGTEEGRGMGW